MRWRAIKRGNMPLSMQKGMVISSRCHGQNKDVRREIFGLPSAHVHMALQDTRDMNPDPDLNAAGLAVFSNSPNRKAPLLPTPTHHGWISQRQRLAQIWDYHHSSIMRLIDESRLFSFINPSSMQTESTHMFASTRRRGMGVAQWSAVEQRRRTRANQPT